MSGLKNNYYGTRLAVWRNLMQRNCVIRFENLEHVRVGKDKIRKEAFLFREGMGVLFSGVCFGGGVGGVQGLILSKIG
jgi:hypothetical protein